MALSRPLPSLITIAKAIGGCGTLIFLWEHTARTNKSNYKPSVAINFCSEKAKLLFKIIGTNIAKLSSFLVYIKFEELYATLYDIVKPTYELCMSPIEIIKGYADKASTYKTPGMIAIGSITLICGIMYGWYRLGHYIPANYRAYWPLRSLSVKNH